MKKLLLIIFLFGIFVFKGADSRQANYYVVRVKAEIYSIEKNSTKATAAATALKKKFSGVTVQKVNSLQGLK